MEDFEDVYRNSVKQMKGFNRDRMAMISRNLQEHKMNSADLEEMLDNIKVEPVIKRHNSLALQKIMLPNVKREMEDALNEQDVRCGQAYHYATTPKPSSASKALNVMRNQQTSDIINLVCKNEFNRLRQRQIQECIRAFNIEQRHIVELKKAFTACSLNARSETTLKELLESIQERGLRYPPLILNFFLNVLNVKDMFDDNAPPASFAQEVANQKGFNGQDRVSFKKLQSLEWIYNHCPMLTSYFYNNSDNFKNAISMNAFTDVDSLKGKGRTQKSKYQPKLMMDAYSPEQRKHIQQLLKQIHIRIEEKFSDYRSAFRSIDQNFDGGLSFQEFVAGCEFSGIQLPIKDYRLVFDVLDYD